MGGIAMSQAVRSTLAASGVQVVGHQWLWAPGVKGGTFEPHKARDKYRVFNVDGFVGDNASEYGALPGEGVNYKYCLCTTKWILRDSQGRFVKFENLRDWVEADRKFAFRKIDGLTLGEQQALQFYSRNGYYYANYQLRTGDRIEGVDEYIRTLDRILKSHRFERDYILKRYESNGRAFGVTDLDKLSSQIGREITWKGYTSTTTPQNNPEFLSDFPVEVTIRAPRGTQGVGIARYSQFGAEEEILLARNSRVRVVSVTSGDDGKYRVTVEIVGQ